tara:strand:- start:44 stop:229 length:186 start_codon:yes stop_codon:yes gene_type:complete
MDGELGIYNKMGGGEKYKTVAVMNGGASKTNKNNQKQNRIERLEKKIETLQKVLDKLKEEK